MVITTMRISETTKDELEKLKTKGRAESYEDVVQRLIEENKFARNFLNKNIAELGKVIATEFKRTGIIA